MVVMIDDDDDTLEIYQLLIEKTSYAEYFVTHNNPYQALEWLKDCAANPSSFPRYILLDLNMPELNGIEFVQKFEQEIDYANLNTEIVVLTSSVRDRDQREAHSYARKSKIENKQLAKDQLLEK
ncbi:MAG: response regulator [Cyclobacteriaceae bacterium]